MLLRDIPRSLDVFRAWLAEPDQRHQLIRIAKRAGCTPDEEDVFQHFVMAKAPRILPKLPADDGEAWRYICFCFGRTCQDHRRQVRRRLTAVGDALTPEGDVPTTAADALSTLGRERLIVAIRDLVPLLPDSARDAIQAICLDELPVAEYAHLRRISSEAAHVRVYRGRQHLRMMILREGAMLSVADVVHWPALISKLAEAHTASRPSPSVAVWRRLGINAKHDVLDDSAQPFVVDHQRRRRIVHALNGVLMLEDFYDDACFADEFERGPVPDILRRFFLEPNSARARKPLQVRWFNRLLFEWVFRDYVSGSSWHDWRLS